MRYANWILLLIFTLVIAVMVTCSNVANAHEYNYRIEVTQELRDQFDGLSFKDKVRFYKNVGDAMGRAHNKFGFELGKELADKSKKCEIPLNTYEDFEQYVRYFTDPAIYHLLNHYIDVVEALENRKVSKKERKSIYRAMTKDLIKNIEKGFDSGMTLRDLYEHILREFCDGNA